jgi:aerobic carbon-monoxide dehydrogenase medium subunit
VTELEIAQPDSIEEACRLLQDRPGDAKVIAGGTAVVLMMRQGLIAPALLVSLQRIAGSSSIELVDSQLRIGANVTLAEVASSEVVRTAAPSLSRACATVGNVRVRNAATLAGNLAEADYASDPPSVLSCIGASCVARGPDGEREIPVADLITGFYSTTLSPAEVITEIRVPQVEEHERDSYLKYVSRSSEDRPCVGVAARASIRNGVLEDVNVVVGAVAPTPVSIPEVCDRARGHPLEDATIRAIADGYAEAIDPMEDARGSSWYRTEMIRVFVARAMQGLRTDA